MFKKRKIVMVIAPVLTNEVFECTLHPHPGSSSAKVYYFQMQPLQPLQNAQQQYLDLLCESIRMIVKNGSCFIILDCSSVKKLELVKSFFKLSLEEFKTLDRADLVKFVMITSCGILRNTAKVLIRITNASSYASVVASKQEAYDALQAALC